MKNKEIFAIYIILALLAASIFLLAVSLSDRPDNSPRASPKLTGSTPELSSAIYSKSPPRLSPDYLMDTREKEGIILHFYDKDTNCPLNGGIYIDDEFLDYTEESSFILTEDEYKNYGGGILCIFGELDECFNDYSGWEFENCFVLELNTTKEKFLRGSVFPFQADINPRQPYRRAMMQFIKPRQVSIYFAEIKPTFSELKDIRKMVGFVRSNINYVDDREFGQKEYWLTPEETLELRKGDCEDWGTASLSLIRAYNEGLRCYDIVTPTHMSIFCYLSDTAYIFDMNLKETKARVRGGNIQKERESLRAFIEEYFESYKIDEEERKVIYAFDENEFYEFHDNEDFINWILELHYNGKLR